MYAFEKTAPADQMRMGAVIRGALERAGVAHRVAGGAAERGRLATTGQRGAAVHITAHGCNGETDYDVPRAVFIGLTAVVTTSTGTRAVYDGIARQMRPTQDARQCARAVAAYLNPDGPRTCLHCGREVTWIENAGQGAWYDSSNRAGCPDNWTECPDGQADHTPEPQCGSCEDYGDYPLHDGSTDAVIGYRQCEDAACVARGVARAVRASTRHTDELVMGDREFGPQVCTQCGWGGYTPVPGRYALGRPVYVCTADGCGYTVDVSAFTLEDGEQLAEHDGRLYVTRAYDGPPF